MAFIGSHWNRRDSVELGYFSHPFSKGKPVAISYGLSSSAAFARTCYVTGIEQFVTVVLPYTGDRFLVYTGNILRKESRVAVKTDADFRDVWSEIGKILHKNEPNVENHVANSVLNSDFRWDKPSKQSIRPGSIYLQFFVAAEDRAAWICVDVHTGRVKEVGPEDYPLLDIRSPLKGRHPIISQSFPGVGLKATPDNKLKVSFAARARIDPYVGTDVEKGKLLGFLNTPAITLDADPSASAVCGVGDYAFLFHHAHEVNPQTGLVERVAGGLPTTTYVDLFSPAMGGEEKIDNRIRCDKPALPMLCGEEYSPESFSLAFPCVHSSPIDNDDHDHALYFFSRSKIIQFSMTTRMEDIESEQAKKQIRLAFATCDPWNTIAERPQDSKTPDRVNRLIRGVMEIKPVAPTPPEDEYRKKTINVAKFQLSICKAYHLIEDDILLKEARKAKLSPALVGPPGMQRNEGLIHEIDVNKRLIPVLEALTANTNWWKDNNYMHFATPRALLAHLMENPDIPTALHHAVMWRDHTIRVTAVPMGLQSISAPLITFSHAAFEPDASKLIPSFVVGDSTAVSLKPDPDLTFGPFAQPLYTHAQSPRTPRLFSYSSLVIHDLTNGALVPANLDRETMRHLKIIIHNRRARWFLEYMAMDTTGRYETSQTVDELVTVVQDEKTLESLRVDDDAYHLVISIGGSDFRVEASETLPVMKVSYPQTLVDDYTYQNLMRPSANIPLLVSGVPVKPERAFIFEFNEKDLPSASLQPLLSESKLAGTVFNMALAAQQAKRIPQYAPSDKEIKVDEKASMAPEIGVFLNAIEHFDAYIDEGVRSYPSIGFWYGYGNTTTVFSDQAKAWEAALIAASGFKHRRSGWRRLEQFAAQFAHELDLVNFDTASFMDVSLWSFQDSSAPDTDVVTERKWVDFYRAVRQWAYSYRMQEQYTYNPENALKDEIERFFSLFPEVKELTLAYDHGFDTSKCYLVNPAIEIQRTKNGPRADKLNYDITPQIAAACFERELRSLIEGTDHSLNTEVMQNMAWSYFNITTAHMRNIKCMATKGDSKWHAISYVSRTLSAVCRNVLLPRENDDPFVESKHMLLRNPVPLCLPCLHGTDFSALYWSVFPDKGVKDNEYLAAKCTYHLARICLMQHFNPPEEVRGCELTLKYSSAFYRNVDRLKKLKAQGSKTRAERQQLFEKTEKIQQILKTDDRRKFVSFVKQKEQQILRLGWAADATVGLMQYMSEVPLNEYDIVTAAMMAGTKIFATGGMVATPSAEDSTWPSPFKLYRYAVFPTHSMLLYNVKMIEITRSYLLNNKATDLPYCKMTMIDIPLKDLAEKHMRCYPYTLQSLSAASTHMETAIRVCYQMLIDSARMTEVDKKIYKNLETQIQNYLEMAINGRSPEIVPHKSIDQGIRLDLAVPYVNARERGFKLHDVKPLVVIPGKVIPEIDIQLLAVLREREAAIQKARNEAAAKEAAEKASAQSGVPLIAQDQTVPSAAQVPVVPTTLVESGENGSFVITSDSIPTDKTESAKRDV